MSIHEEGALETVWNALHAYAEDSLGGRIGQGRFEYNDDDHAGEWAEICEAMADIRQAMGLPSLAELEG